MDNSKDHITRLASFTLGPKRYRCWNIQEKKMYGPFDWVELLRGGMSPDALWFQSTGMDTGEGIEIFEGDIVSRYCPDAQCSMMHTGVVVYLDQVGCFVIKDLPQDIDYPLAVIGMKGEIYAPSVIIGNVLENPERAGIAVKAAMVAPGDIQKL